MRNAAAGDLRYTAETAEHSPSRWAEIRDYLRMDRVASAVPALDGLRGIAILLVLARHSTRVFAVAGMPVVHAGEWGLLNPAWNGWMGVDLFFVLSGFLISHHVLKRWTPGEAWRPQARTYLVKRVLRIVPAYYAFVAIIALGVLPFYPPPPGLRILKDVLFLQDLFPYATVVVFWSLGVEEKFYLVAPLVLLWVRATTSNRARFAVVLVFVLLPVLLKASVYLVHRPSLDTYADWFPLLRSPFYVSFDALFVGCLCAVAFRYAKPLAPRPRALLFAAGAAVIGYLLCAEPLLETIGVFDCVLLTFTLALGFGAIVFATLGPEQPYTRWLGGRTLFFFSKISYSLYLVHLVFTQVTYEWLERFVALNALPLGAQFAIYAPVYALTSIAAALLLHYLAEKPFLILKDRL